MNWLKANITKDYLARVLFLIVPTWLMCFFILWLTRQYFAVIMASQYQMQSLYLGLGMVASCVFYSFRFRFLPTFGLLLLGFYILYQTIDHIAFGEFDAFFYSIQFLIFAMLFSFGWFLAWGFLRHQRFPIIASSFFFIIGVYLISKQNKLELNSLLQAFVPLILYTLYIIYASQLIRKQEDVSRKFWPYLITRLGLFLALASIIVFTVIASMQSEIKQKLAEFGSGGKKGDASMLKKHKDGSYTVSELTSLSGRQQKSNQLLFVAKINNYFDDGTTPNPLYLTAFYYTKYDTATETFEPDSLIPRNDLFRPNPNKIGLYFTKTDSSVLVDPLQEQHMKTVEIEVYKTLLSPNEFVAPTTAFFVQAISVDKANKQQYKSAYRAKSYVSDLNSAYFVYNPGAAPMLQAFQEQRFEILRQVKDYSHVSKEFLDYYVSIPQSGKFKAIGDLAKKITASKTSNIDKMIAIRDYFLSKDDNGKPLFKYSDNPGIPDIPSASKLNYFLFENRKGYCAYYAGATLYMLRSLGIPSRIVAGFLTQDRNTGQNKGWYWFYANQAHAWVQVYFPGYGWIDFDTTVANEDAQQSPQPDGTPPNTPGNAILAIDGIIADVDTLKKLATIKADKMLFKDQIYDQVQERKISLELSLASIEKDSLQIGIQQLKAGDAVTAISYAEVFKDIPKTKNTPVEVLLERFPSPAPIDELHVKVESPHDKELNKGKSEKEPLPKWKFYLYATIVLFLVLGLFFWAFAYLYKMYLNLRRSMSKSFAERCFWDFRYTQFYLHQLAYEKGNLSAYQFAQKMDQVMPLQYSTFVQLYLKLKYAHQELTQQEKVFVSQYRQAFDSVIQKKVARKTSFKRFWNPIRTINFLSAKKDS